MSIRRLTRMGSRARRVAGPDASGADQAFDYQPRLRGSLLRLRPLGADDFTALRAAAADPGIWEQHPVKGRHREEVFRPYFEMLLSSREALVAVDRQTEEVVGMSRFHGYDPQ